MIDEKKIEALRYSCGLEPGEPHELFDTLAALWKVAKAAREQRGWKGHPDCSSCTCSKCVELDASLAALDDGKEAGK